MGAALELGSKCDVLCMKLHLANHKGGEACPSVGGADKGKLVAASRRNRSGAISRRGSGDGELPVRRGFAQMRGRAEVQGKAPDPLRQRQRSGCVFTGWSARISLLNGGRIAAQ